ncbi:MAG: hypothetical protein HY680_01180, partial [Chloroflexi bacterium]|nr:hypothetical protein [Chloroflexota bacterium]
MTFKEVSRVEVKEIIRRWQSGEKMQVISRGTGISRNTVKKYIRAARECGLTRGGFAADDFQMAQLVQLNLAGPRRTKRPAGETLEGWAETIREWVQVEKLTLTRVQELLGQKNCSVSYMSLQ